MCRFSDERSQKFQAVKDAIVCLARGVERDFVDPRPSCEGSLNLYFPWSDFSEAQYSETLNTWLDPVPAIDDLNRIKSNRLQRSCEWVQHEPQFRKWLDGGSYNILWLTGPPGCGKSTLATRIIEDLQISFTVAFFFCSFNDTNRQGLSQLLRTWAWQVLRQRDHLMGTVFQVYSETVGANTPLASYQKALKCLLEAGGPCYLVVDGLDECSQEDYLLLRSVLTEVVHYARILVVSRWEGWIESSLPVETITITISPEKTRDDIERWIRHQVEMLGCEQREATFMIQQLIKGAKGMFLWAQLMMRHVRQQATLNDMMSALGDLPVGLEGLYDRLLQRIYSLPPARLKVAQHLLQWTFSATRLLSIPELEVALAVTPGSDYLDYGNTVPNLRAFVRDSCSPLLEVDEGSSAIRFVHASALDFFIRQGRDLTYPMRHESPIFTPNIQNAHSAAICLTYLAYEEHGFVPHDIDPDRYDDNLLHHLKQRPFLEYCALNWWKHLPNLQSTTYLDQEKISRSVKLFTSNQSAIVRWIQLFQLLDAGRDCMNRDPRLFQPTESPYTLLYSDTSSSFSNIWYPPSGLFSRWHRWTTEITFNGRHSTPIGIAAFFDFVDVITFERNHGKRPDVADALGLTPLMLAAHGESPKAVSFLLGGGADSRKTSLFGYGVARYALRNAVTVMGQLLEAGASVSACARTDGLNAVQTACSSAGLHPSILPELLKHASIDDLNEKNFMGQSALHIAARLDIGVSVDLFVERLTNTSSDTSGPKQLRTTAEEAFTPITTSSIQKWAQSWGYVLPDVSARTWSRAELRSCLTALIRHVKVTIICNLGQKGVSFDNKDDIGRTCLHLAIEAGYGDNISSSSEHEPDQVIVALLKFGSRADIAHPLGYLPLDLAITHGKWSAVRALSSENAPSTVLTSPEVRQFTSMPAPGSPLQQEAPQSTSKRPLWRPSYHPQSPLAVYHTAFLLRQRLKSVSEQLYLQKSCTGILELILDSARYWTRCSDEVKANSHDVFQWSKPQKLTAEITIGEGLIRKIEIILTPNRTFMGPSGFDLTDYRFYGGYTTPYFSSVQPNQPTKHSILDVSFRSKRHRYETRDQTFPVSGDRWVETTDNDNDNHSWMQAWQLPRYHNPNTEWTSETDKPEPQLSDKVVDKLIKSLENGDRIILKPTTNFFVQDIALYSGFRLNIYYSWDLTSPSKE